MNSCYIFLGLLGQFPGLLPQTVTFDQWDSGQNYSFAMAHEDFGDYPNFFNAPLLPFNASLAFDPYQHTVMRVLYREGLYSDTGSGAIWRAAFDEGQTAVSLTFLTRFDEAFAFVRGGKFHGLCSGYCPSNAQSSEERGMSARFMWREASEEELARLVLYTYHSDQPGVYGQDLPLLYGGPRSEINADGSLFFPDLNQSFLIGYEARDHVGGFPVVRVPRGAWFELSLTIGLNSPGIRNGYILAFIDGQLVLNCRGFLFAGSQAQSEDYLLRYFLFQTFHGGGDTSWAPPRDVTADFDNFLLEPFSLEEILRDWPSLWPKTQPGTFSLLELLTEKLPYFWPAAHQP